VLFPLELAGVRDRALPTMMRRAFAHAVKN
jgi:hypothetical protein